jgi:hypothetical protein
VPSDTIDALTAGIQKNIVVILEQERQIVIKRVGNSVLTYKGTIKNLESGLRGRSGGSAQRTRRSAPCGAGDAEGGDCRNSSSLADSNLSRH